MREMVRKDSVLQVYSLEEWEALGRGKPAGDCLGGDPYRCVVRVLLSGKRVPPWGDNRARHEVAKAVLHISKPVYWDWSQEVEETEGGYALWCYLTVCPFTPR